jgi:tetrahydromethanopterin S-methyltransferase subunit G
MEISEEKLKKVKATLADEEKLKEVIERLDNLSNKLDRTQKSVSSTKKKLR